MQGCQSNPSIHASSSLQPILQAQQRRRGSSLPQTQSNQSLRPPLLRAAAHILVSSASSLPLTLSHSLPLTLPPFLSSSSLVSHRVARHPSSHPLTWRLVVSFSLDPLRLVGADPTSLPPTTITTTTSTASDQLQSRFSSVTIRLAHRPDFSTPVLPSNILLSAPDRQESRSPSGRGIVARRTDICICIQSQHPSFCCSASRSPPKINFPARTSSVNDLERTTSRLIFPHAKVGTLTQAYHPLTCTLLLVF